MRDRLVVIAQACGGYDLEKLLFGVAKFLINNNIFTFRRMGKLISGCQQPTRDDVGFILATQFKACLERLDGRRQYENADGFGVVFADLPGALPVDFQYDIATGPDGLINAVTWRAI